MLRTPFRRWPKIPAWKQADPAQMVPAVPLSVGEGISLQEAVDLLHKLREESAQVQAIYSGSDGVSSVLRGIVQPPIEDGLWSVVSQYEITGSALSFDLNSATTKRFGDEASMSGAALFPFRFRFASALCFGFSDGSTLHLFELDQTTAHH